MCYSKRKKHTKKFKKKGKKEDIWTVVKDNTARVSCTSLVTVGPTEVSLFCSLMIPKLINERTLVDKVNTYLFYLTLLGCFYAIAKHTQATLKMGLCLFI